MSNEEILSIKELSVIYNSGCKAVNNVSFSLKKGEILGITGVSGSGKSSIAKAILKLYDTSNTCVSGQIVYQNIDLFTLNEQKLNQIRGNKIAYMVQDSISGFDPTMKIGKQFIEILTCKKSRMSGKSAWKSAEEWVKKCNLSVDVLKKYPYQLSGGMLQRLSLGMAVLGSPVILIVDEPTTALDTVNQKRVLDLLKKTGKERNINMIVISHDIQMLLNLCQRIIIMDSGEIAETGTSDEILHSQNSVTASLIKAIPGIGQER